MAIVSVCNVVLIDRSRIVATRGEGYRISTSVVLLIKLNVCVDLVWHLVIFARQIDSVSRSCKDKFLILGTAKKDHGRPTHHTITREEGMLRDNGEQHAGDQAR